MLVLIIFIFIMLKICKKPKIDKSKNIETSQTTLNTVNASTGMNINGLQSIEMITSSNDKGDSENIMGEGGMNDMLCMGVIVMNCMRLQNQ